MPELRFHYSDILRGSRLRRARVWPAARAGEYLTVTVFRFRQMSTRFRFHDPKIKVGSTAQDSPPRRTRRLERGRIVTNERTVANQREPRENSLTHVAIKQITICMSEVGGGARAASLICDFAD
ncbi:hypothetical protein EVAR_19568_1 [Eumeta japonica]|uniref:Uncharacterized protein n=1 Tax=Eumeta variegata TaxID=151549 RepID=A0A4C1UFB6_EUMVA|nr:hypothetical protein EVAR_19568_1 [Eumeta japonica]